MTDQGAPKSFKDNVLKPFIALQLVCNSNGNQHRGLAIIWNNPTKSNSESLIPKKKKKKAATISHYP